MKRERPGKSFISYFIYPFTLFLPIIVFHWMLPFLGGAVIGNDYPLFSITQQLELMFSIKTGTFPLYMPGIVGGQTSASFTLGQVFHPISWFSSHMPGYWNGMALEWNTLFRIISLGLAQLFLFEFLRRAGFANLISFLLSFVTVYNLEMLNMFRFGASLEAWTGFIFVCSSIGVYYLQPTRIWGPMLIIISTYWLTCSGHPQMMYYGILGAFLFTLTMPFWVSAIFPSRDHKTKDVLIFWGRIAIFFGIGVLLSSAYLFPLYFDFIKSNAGRVGQGYAWADMYPDTFIGTLNNFLQPLKTSVEGNFGGTGLFLVAALSPVLLLLRVKAPRVILTIWLLTLLAFLYMQGARTPVHFLVWEYLPLASNFRIAGRIAFIMPMLIMLLLGWIFQFSFPKINIPPVLGRSLAVKMPLVLGSLALIIILLDLLLFSSYIPPENIYYAPLKIRIVPDYIMNLNIIFSVASLLLFCMYNIFTERKHFFLVILCAVTVTQVTVLIAYGTWIEDKKQTPAFADMIAYKNRDMTPNLFIGKGMASKIVDMQIERSFLEPFLGKFYSRHVIANNNDFAYGMMARIRTPDLVVLEGLSQGDRLMADGLHKKENHHSHVALTYNSYNRLDFSVTTDTPGFLGLSYPFTGNWNAILNGRGVPVYQANGAAQAVYVPKGNHFIEFRYWSQAAFWGWMISCSIIVLAGTVAGLLISRRAIGITFALVSFALGVGLFFLWYLSLYDGRNLGTVYAWNSPISQDYNNIAYGKHTEMSQYGINEAPLKYRFHSSRAVDGDVRPQSAFSTDTQMNPWWLVDLAEDRSIGSVVLYEGMLGEIMHMQQMTISFSSDKVHWISGPLSILKFPQRVSFHPTLAKARYIKISIIGQGLLSFGEVEVYPPGTSLMGKEGFQVQSIISP